MEVYYNSKYVLYKYICIYTTIYIEILLYIYIYTYYSVGHTGYTIPLLSNNHMKYCITIQKSVIFKYYSGFIWNRSGIA